MSFVEAVNLFGLNWQLKETENYTFENGQVKSEATPTNAITVLSGDSGKLGVFLQENNTIDSGEVDVGRRATLEVPPGVFWRSQVFMDQPQFLKFNISLQKDALIGVYGRKGLPPSHTQYDFVELLDGSRLIAKETRSLIEAKTGGRHARSVSLHEAGFIQYLDSGIWHLAFYNDGKNPEQVSFNTIVIGDTFGPAVDEMLQQSQHAEESTKELVRLLPKHPPSPRKPATQWQPMPQFQKKLTQQVTSTSGGPTRRQPTTAFQAPCAQKTGTGCAAAEATALGYCCHKSRAHSPEATDYWNQCTTDSWVLNTVQAGYSLNFQHGPPPFQGETITIVTYPQAIAQASKSSTIWTTGSFALGLQYKCTSTQSSSPTIYIGWV
ncbi:UNVERIFIED_CONTAM: hypothetical protein FKN15_046416 [Acipenser sinensis]